jgi:hypothetical protein
MTTKICSKCGIEKELSEFYKNKTRKDGYHNWCKKCHDEHEKQKYLNNPEKKRQIYKNWELNNPLKNLIGGCRSRAKINNIICDSPEDLYEHLKPIYDIGKCEFCNNDLKSFVGTGKGKQVNSYSIDQIIPCKGYIVGNVAILCLNCNMKKRNNTYEDFKHWVKWYEDKITMQQNNQISTQQIN